MKQEHQAVIKMIRDNKIPEEHWEEFNRMISEETKKHEAIEESQRLKDEDWHNQFTI